MDDWRRLGSRALAGLVNLDQSRPTRVLDIAASHGMWGIAFAKKYPRASLVALDWKPVLEVTRENAEKAGVGDRFSTIAGSAFEVDLGSDYDLVLICFATQIDTPAAEMLAICSEVVLVKMTGSHSRNRSRYFPNTESTNM